MAKKAAASAKNSSAKKPAVAKKPVIAKKAAAKPALEAKKITPPKKAVSSTAKAPGKEKVLTKAAPVAKTIPESPKKDPKKEAKKEISAEVKAAPLAEKVEAEKAPPEPKPVKVPKLKKSEQAKINADKAALNEEERRWNEFHEKHKTDKAQTYDMKATFEAAQPLQHKILGWGWILSNDNDRLEVLFRDGKRILISNYNR